MNFPFELSAGKKFDAAGFGTNAVDYLIRVPEYPVFNSKVELDGYIRAAGGEAASAIVGLQRLGLKTAYIGRFGGDAEGEYGLQTLVDEGVNIAFSERRADAKTQIAFILIDARNGERTVIWQRDEKLAYTESDVPLDAAVLAKVLHITPHDTKACIRLVRAAKAAGAVISIDIDKVFDGIDELLPLVDVCIASPDLAEKLAGLNDNRRALRGLKSRFGCPVIAVTLGASGSIVLSEDSIIETAGFDVPGGCVDTTGAGDAFRAGFLYGMLKRQTIEQSARIANAVAALKCRRPGARAGLPTQNELTLLLKNI